MALPQRRKSPTGGSRLSTDKLRGCLLGLSVGDALGVASNGRRMQAPPFPRLSRVDQPPDMVAGGGKFPLKKGQVSWVTQSACVLSESLRAKRAYDREDTRARLLAWRTVVAPTQELPKDLIEALDGLKPQYADLSSVGKVLWHKSNRRLATNGALIRAAPLGLYFAQEAETRRRACFEELELTNFDPRCQLASIALNEALAFFVRAPPPSPRAKAEAWIDSLLGEIESGLAIAAAELAQRLGDFLPEIQDARVAIQEDLALAKTSDPLLYGPELQLWAQPDFVRVAFRLAFWELFNAPTLWEALVDVTARGGNTCVNAAVCGALFGARDGEGAIPPAWRGEVLGALSFRAQGPFWEVYHPRILLELASARDGS